MAIAHGDNVIPAGVFNSVSGVADLTVGSLCPEGLNMGIYYGAGGSSDDIVWNNGISSVPSALANPAMLRLCTAYSGAQLFGQVVQLVGAGPSFRGPVVQQLNTELDDTEGDGTQVPIVVIKAAGFFFVAEPANIEVL